MAEAQYELARHLGLGWRVAQNRRELVRWLGRAAEALPAAQCSLARCTLDDATLPASVRRRRAKRLFQAAADAGIPAAEYGLAKMELAQSPSRGRLASIRRRLQHALRAGSGEAGLRLALDVETLGGDLAKVERWLQRAVVVEDDEFSALWTLELIRRAKPFLRRIDRRSTDGRHVRAQAGDLEALVDEGYAIHFGRGVRRDPSAAGRRFLQAARRGSSEAQLALALTALASMDYPSRQDARLERAARWSRSAAKDGDPVALWAAAQLEDRRTRRNPRLAVRWLNVAAKKGHARAAFDLTEHLTSGFDAPSRPRSAVPWMQVAAEGGVSRAQVAYGEMFDTGTFVARSPRTAALWIRRAAEAGDPDAQLKLGVRLHEGDGVRRDDRECVRWYRRAARAGNAIAAGNLGLCHRYGHGVRRNLGTALRWLRRAVRLGNGRSARTLAYASAGGWSGRRDAALELVWLRIGAALEDPDCLCELGRLHFNGKRAPMDRPFAMLLYRAAAHAESARAHYFLGCAHRDGEGVPRSGRQARAWFHKAEALGESDAGLALRATLRAGRDPDR